MFLSAAAFVYELPVGKGKRYMNSGGASNAVGGWQVSTILRYSSGLPRTSARASATSPDSSGRVYSGHRQRGFVFAQDKGSFDRAKGPLFNKAAFQSVYAFNFYDGRESLRGMVRAFGYHNQDLSFIKNTRLGGFINESSLRDFQFVELAHVQQSGRVGRSSVQQRHFKSGLRKPERIRHRADHADSGALRV